MFKTNQKRIIKLTAAAIAVAMVGVGSVACSKPDTIKNYEYETSTYKEQVIKDIDSNVKESAQNSKVEIDLNRNEVTTKNTEKSNENKANNESNMMLSGQISKDPENTGNTNIAVKNTEYKEGDVRLSNEINDYERWLEAQNGHPQGTDRFGRPFLKEGAEYTWSASGEPNEAPTNGRRALNVVNPNTGVKYRYYDTTDWKVDTTEEERAKTKRDTELITKGGIDPETGEIFRKLTPEEAKEIAAMYSTKFKE